MDVYLQNILLSSSRGRTEYEYWAHRLEGDVTPSVLTQDCKYAAGNSYISCNLEYLLDKELYNKLDYVSNHSLYGKYVILLSCIDYVIYYYTGLEDIITGMPGLIQESIGEYMHNLLPLKIKINSSSDCSDLLNEVKNAVMQADKNQNLPLNAVVELLKLEQTGEKVKFPIVILMDNIHRQECLDEIETDLLFSFHDNGDGLKLNLSFNGSKYSKRLAEQICGHIQSILIQFLNDMRMPLLDIQILSVEEKELVLNGFNQTFFEYDKTRTITDLFEDQAKNEPEHIALGLHDHMLTYDELDKLSNQFANLLYSKGVREGTIVAVMTERSIEMIACILGILKAGGVYLPIDSNYPENRMNYILEDSGVTILVKSPKVRNNKAESSPQINVINIKEGYRKESVQLSFQPDKSKINLAYIIYTSGSTGNPKGVMVRHQGAVNLKAYFENTIKVSKDDRVLQFASSSFDASIYELLMAFTTGASLYLAEEEIIKDYNAFTHYMNQYQITIAVLPPVYLNNLEPDQFSYLKKIVTAGSATTKQLVQKWMEKVTYINAYGPTESTICITTYVVDKEMDIYNSVPIGTPVPNTKVYILNKNRKAVPVGVAGELCVSGDMLAEGYLNKPELTAEKFIKDPFQEHSLMYCTGDLARWESDGTIDFLGRIDNQVKIRGFRIELDDIEKNVLLHPHIKEAVVLTKQAEDNENYLCVFYEAVKALESSELREFLSEYLPDYMIPAMCIQIEEMPLTFSGKIDRKQLAQYKPKEKAILKDKPVTENEVILSGIWEEVLGIKPIGIKENFFELGGDSIKAMQVLAQLGKYHLKLNMKELFQLKTIEKVAKAVTADTIDYGEQKEIEGEIPLIPIQKWFLMKNFRSMHHWNQSVLLHCKIKMNEELVRQVLSKVMEHHDGLRIILKDGRMLYNCSIKEFNSNVLEVCKITSENPLDDILKIADKAQERFQLDRGPLIKVILMQTESDDYLFITAHHIVIDGVSWRILFEDFSSGYIQAASGLEIGFQDKTTSYKTWAEKLNTYVKDGELKKEIKYWKKIDHMEVPSLPVEHTVLHKAVKETSLEAFHLHKDQTYDLLTKVNKAYNTEITDILLAAFVLALRKWSSLNRFKINLEGHGRNELFENVNVSRTIGWFTTQYPLILDLEDCRTITDVIKTVKEAIREIPQNGIGYGLYKYLDTEADKGESNCREDFEAEISFNYLGQFGTDLDSAVFELAEMQSSNAIHPDSENMFQLNVNGIINKDELIMSIMFNNNEYNPESKTELSNYYETYLVEIINYCRGMKETERTASDFELKGISLEAFDRIQNKWGESIDKLYPLSPMQQGMLFYDILDKNADTYIQQIAFEVNGTIDLGKLTRCFQKIVERHDILRTSFIYKNLPYPLQVVFKERKAEISNEDFSDFSKEDKEAAYMEFIKSDRKRGFRLEDGNLFRMALLKMDTQEYKLVWSFHHIIMDGWCLGILTKEIFELYKDISGTSLPSAPVFKQFIDWIHTQNKENGEEYWSRYLEDYNEKATLAPKGIKVTEYIRQEKFFSVNEIMTKHLSEIAASMGVTLNTVIQAVWGIILLRYNNTDDVVFGAVTSGRNVRIENIEHMLGLFINTLPVRVKADKNDTFSSLAVKLQEDSLEGDKYSYCPLAEIQEKSTLKGELINHIIVFENFPLERMAFSGENKESLGFGITYDFSFQQTNYDLSITISPEESMGFKFVYNEAVFSGSFVEQLFQNIIKIMHDIVQNPNLPADEIEILDDAKRNMILKQFNNTKRGYDFSSSFVDLFEEQVQKTSHSIAIKCLDAELTYAELNNKANALANHLLYMKIDRSKPILILLEPSAEMPIGILGCLKAGMAYVPVEPSSSEMRIWEVLEDCKAQLILTRDENLEQISKYQIPALSLNNCDSYSLNEANPQIERSSNDLMYIIYTSGTTGKPKGIMLENKGLVNYCRWFISEFDIDENDSTILVSPFAYDLGYTIFYTALLCGAKLHLVKKEFYSNTMDLLQYVQKEKITYMKTTPSYFHLFVNNKYFNNFQLRLQLRLLLLGGEKINLKDVKTFHEKYNQVKIVNHYGPTEATIGCIAHEIDLEHLEQFAKTPVIGKAIGNTSAYILDSRQKPVPIGVTGEIYIAGPGLARGYLNREDLTKEKFISNPFNDMSRNMYKTGDLGRYTENGTIEYIGRIDSQVKIRGYRVELKEIEQKLLSIETIEQAVVMVKEEGENQAVLCAYLVAIDGEAVVSIRKEASKILPDYMVPQSFVFLQELPLTKNNKVDLQHLKQNSFTDRAKIEVIPPANNNEEVMLQIWKEVLGNEEIGVENQFFDIGGHSIKLIELISRIYEIFEVELSPQQVIQAETVRGLAKCLYNKEYKESQYLQLLNREQEKKIFFLPPVGGYGLVYKMLADQLPDYACYSFNYMVGSSELLGEYVKQIKEVQKNGPYRLSGWSAGGNLAYEVAKELEKQGEEVSQIYLFDTYKNIGITGATSEEIESMVELNINMAQEDPIYRDYLKRNEFIKQQVKDKMKDYFDYLRNKMTNEGMIQADVHLILSEDELVEDDRRLEWKHTAGERFIIHQGYGSHSGMLYNESVEWNAELMRKVLQ